MSKIDFYTHPMSRGQIARWALHEVGAEYEQHLLVYADTGAKGMKSPAYLAINPMGKVPAIVHNDKVVTEGGAICAYLADAFPQQALGPQADERAAYYRWLFFAAGPLEAAITNRSMGFEVPPDKTMMAGYGHYDHVVDNLTQHFASSHYVCGDRFTMADVYVGAQVVWGLQFGTLPARDVLNAYADRLTQRAPYQQAKAIDTALIAASQSA